MEEMLGRNRKLRKGDLILCPHCGGPTSSLTRIKEMITYGTELSGRCRCGQEYTIKLLPPNSVSFPDSLIDVVC
jgi:hypothetical protein